MVHRGWLWANARAFPGVEQIRSASDQLETPRLQDRITLIRPVMKWTR